MKLKKMQGMSWILAKAAKLVEASERAGITPRIDVRQSKEGLGGCAFIQIGKTVNYLDFCAGEKIHEVWEA